MTAADLLSLARIPLGIVFVLIAHRPQVALVVLGTAAATDVLDGWVARRAHRASPPVPGVPHRGDWLDPLCDKLFALAVVAGLLLSRAPPLSWLVLLMAREQLQLISVIAMRVVPSLRQAAHSYDFRAHPVGKATTVAQFVASGALLLGHPTAGPLCVVAAVLGIISVGIYVLRVRALLPGAGPPAAPPALS